MTEIEIGPPPGGTAALPECDLGENPPSAVVMNPSARRPLVDEMQVGQNLYSITIVPVAVAPTFVKVTVRCKNANRVFIRMWYEFTQTGPAESLRAVRALVLSGESFDSQSLPSSSVTHWPKAAFQSKIKALLFGKRSEAKVEKPSLVAMHSNALDAR